MRKRLGEAELVLLVARHHVRALAALFDGTIAEDFEELGMLGLRSQTFGEHRLKVDGCTSVKDLKVADIDYRVDLLEVLVVETTSWEFTVERHLTAFEADADTPTRASLLALMPLAGCLTMTTTFTSSETFGGVCGTFDSWNIFEIHDFRSLDFRRGFAETDILNFLV